VAREQENNAIRIFGYYLDELRLQRVKRQMVKKTERMEICPAVEYTELPNAFSVILS
jgi:hypothetical protein